MTDIFPNSVVADAIALTSSTLASIGFSSPIRSIYKISPLKPGEDGWRYLYEHPKSGVNVSLRVSFPGLSIYLTVHRRALTPNEPVNADVYFQFDRYLEAVRGDPLKILRSEIIKNDDHSLKEKHVVETLKLFRESSVGALKDMLLGNEWIKAYQHPLHDY